MDNIVNELNKILNAVTSIEEPADASDGVVKVASFLQREKFISMNAQAIAQCKKIIERLEALQHSAVRAHNVDKKNITRLNGGDNEDEITKDTSGEVTVATTTNSWSSVCARPRPILAIPLKPAPVEIEPGVVLPAVRVDKFDLSMTPGTLYYIQAADRFGIIIAGKLFEGNIGKIFNGSPPTKAKNCSHKVCNVVGCTYHHPGETRNYTPMSWVYAVGPDSYKYKICRKFGDRDNLVIDKKLMTAEQKEIFFDQTIHDILCSLVLGN